MMNTNAKIFQYEYAMYLAISELFHAVKNRSMKLTSLNIYFKELPHRKDDNDKKAVPGKQKTQESLVEKLKALVERDVKDFVDFPMIDACAAEVLVYPLKDGSHAFVFTDGIYGFRVHLEFNDKKTYPKRIRLTSLNGSLLDYSYENSGYETTV